METVEKWIVAADSNDGLIKEGLKQLEATVTEQGVAIPALRGDVQGAVKDIASVMDRGRAGGGQYQSLRPDRVGQYQSWCPDSRWGAEQWPQSPSR